MATAVEEEVIAWLCALCGMDHGERSLVSGGTVSNLTALLVALQSVTQGRFRTEGVWALQRRPIILASDQANYSVAKSAATAGLGEQSVVKITTDEAFRMDTERLRTTLREVRVSDASPVMVVATVGRQMIPGSRTIDGCGRLRPLSSAEYAQDSSGRM